MTPAELIHPAEPGTPGPYAIRADFRADFPTTEGEYGNNTIAQALRDALPSVTAARVVVDSEFSALFVTGGRNDLQVVLNTLQSMKASGFGQHPAAVEAPRMTVGQRAAKDRIQDLLAAMVVQGHDPDDITVALKALGYG